MPELPEVETTRRGIEPHLVNQTVAKVVIRTPKLRWPIPKNLNRLLAGKTILAVERRAKYLLIYFAEQKANVLIIHLGMTGSLRILPEPVRAQKHEHFDLQLGNGMVLRYQDPRKFGAILWTNEDPLQHPLLVRLGPEPLARAFTADYLFKKIQQKKQPIKQVIMDNHVVVGVGNIYANESCFLAGIHPLKAAGQLTQTECSDLVKAIKLILRKAIKAGGTTLQDFLQSDGEPGYFKQKLNVYGREGEACFVCGSTLIREVVGQRATVFCEACQS